MMASKVKRIEDYQAVEFMRQGETAARIDTDIVVLADDVMTCKFRLLNSATGYIFGSSADGDNPTDAGGCTVWRKVNPNGIRGMMNAEGALGGFTYEFTRSINYWQNHTLEVTFTRTTASITDTLNDGTVFTAYYDNILKNDSGRMNFCVSRNVTSGYLTYEAHRFTVTGKHDLRPSYRKADGVAGLLDTVTRRFYPASGIFILGSDIPF